MTKINKRFVFLGLIIILFLAFIFSLSVGGSKIGVGDIFNYFFNKTKIDNIEQYKIIIFDIRLPRVVVTLFVGGCLAVSGVLIQAVLKNPLADTGILGIQGGATIAALLIILVYPGLSSWLPIVSFVGGIVVFIILILSSTRKGLSPIRLILLGVAINALLGSVIGLLTMYNSDKIQDALSWLNGSFAAVSKGDAYTIVIDGSVGLILAILLTKKCNLLLLDDENIVTLGENLNLIRFLVASVAVFLSALSVSVVGIVGFIGLVVPHIGRILVGSKHQYLIPFSFFLGAILTTFADALQKLIFNPIEIPAGIIISFIGAFFFFGLLLKETKI